MNNLTNITDWSEINVTALPDNADELIAEKVATMRNELRSSNFGDVFESDRIAKYRDQVFAVFGHTANQLCNWMMVDCDGSENAWRPAILNGVAFESCPDEGKCGTLHWFWSSRRNEWRLTWFSAGGWIYTKEFEQQPDEISENIYDEVASGKTPITGNNSKPWHG